ncbi:MAG: hypothetical protein ABIA21_01760 [Candidatus Aenigmatarchaeota archaeon]
MEEMSVGMRTFRLFLVEEMVRLTPTYNEALGNDGKRALIELYVKNFSDTEVLDIFSGDRPIVFNYSGEDSEPIYLSSKSFWNYLRPDLN